MKKITDPGLHGDQKSQRTNFSYDLSRTIVDDFPISAKPTYHFYESYQGSRGFAPCQNAPSSIFIEKVRTFSTLAGISNMDFLKTPIWLRLKKMLALA